MANDGYTSCVGLRKIGVDTELFYVSPSHVASLPEWEMSESVDYTKLGSQDSPHMEAFKWNRPSFCHPVMNQVGNAILLTRNYLSELSNFDVVVGHWPFPLFLYHLRGRNKITVPYIIYEAGMIRNLDNPYHSDVDTLKVYKEAPLIMFANVDMLPILSYHKLEKHCVYVPLAVDTERYVPKENKNDHLVFLHPTRHYHDEKGNDRVIAAFAEYIKHNPTAELRLCDWGGDDLAKSKLLCYRYNLSKNVTWLPILAKPDLIKEYQKADAVFDQYVFSATGSTTPEAMSCGRPVCTRIAPELFQQYHGSVPPVLNAQEPEQILAAMRKLEDETFRKELGEQARRWVQEQQGIKVVAEKQRQVCQRVLDAFKGK